MTRAEIDKGGLEVSANALKTEFERETRATRRYLERIPGDRMDWRPHQKSFTVGGLASHIVDCVRWTEAIFASDEFNVDPAVFAPYHASSVAELLATFDADVARGVQALAATGDAALANPWRMTIGGKVRFERPRTVVFRDFTLSHLIHHRGQLSVYLRLLDVAVPGAYGPTADEQS
jgi:uncharacterized damage-inducible protein DinB